MTPIRNIVFDLGGVLIDYDLQRSIDAFRALGFMQIDQYINPYRQFGVFLQLEEGKFTIWSIARLAIMSMSGRSMPPGAVF